MGKSKVWRNGGKEDRFVEKLISEGSFTKNTKVASMKEKYPAIFGGFSDNVMRNHLNNLKRKKGLYLYDAGGLSDLEQEEDGPQSDDAVIDPPKTDAVVSKSLFSDTFYKQHNFPIICETYKDPLTSFEMVLVMVNLPGGAENIKMELSTDGTSVVVKYTWAESWYNANELFKNFVTAKEFTMQHPKVAALNSALEKCRARIDDAPQGLTTVDLPFKVQTGPETWKRNGIVRDNGMIIAMGEFTGCVKEYHTKDASIPLNR